MELQIVGKNLEITEAIDDYVRKKFEKLLRYLPGIDNAKVEIYEENTRSPEHRFTAQVTVKSKGILLRAEEKGVNAYMALDAVADVLVRQIRRYKGKLQKRNKGISLARQTPATQKASTAGETEVMQEVVKIKRFAVKSMSADEATEQMELLSHDFFLFLNVDSGALNLVYRRKDGNYGLIEPELA